MPGRRKTIIEVAQEAERRGFPGIYGPSLGDGLALCEAIALTTNEIQIGTSITPIYTRNVADFASTVGFIHEVSDGRFRFGVGVSHAPAMDRLGVKHGKPLSDKLLPRDAAQLAEVGQVCTDRLHVGPPAPQVSGAGFGTQSVGRGGAWLQPARRQRQRVCFPRARCRKGLQWSLEFTPALHHRARIEHPELRLCAAVRRRWQA